MCDASGFDELPLSSVLFRYLWPFWLFKDASRGDRWVRSANYQHNRGMRVFLPGYLLKWLISCALMLKLTAGFEALSSDSFDVFLLLTAASGIALACGVCVLVIIGYVYLYLGYNQH